jgi:murein L,D-transpeptidase YcbB/YkuD
LELFTRHNTKIYNIFFVSFFIAGGILCNAIASEFKEIPNGTQGIAIPPTNPENQAYQRLAQALRHYMTIAAAGGWPVIPSGPVLRPGDTDKRIPILRKRLMISGDLGPNATGKTDFFDKTLNDAVMHFQKRHGLKPDGVVGPETINEINIPIEERIRQIELNLGRWRLIPFSTEYRYIIINIADFELKLIEDGKPIMKMKVIVGRDYRQTPVFTSEITSITINPYWHIPYSIAVKDILPELRKDPGYLDKKHIKVINSNGKEDSEAFYDQIEWKNISKRDFNYRLRQEPGPLNALGRLKFDIPNQYGVYLHDTPAQALFKKTRRGFSSGCIRLERPLDIAAYLLNDDADWPREKILEAIESKKTRTIRLKRPIPVHVVYITAWVSEDGLLNFRQDIYGRDAIPEKALQQAAHTME